MSEQKVVEYSWQFGPFPCDPTSCNHRESIFPYNDEFSVFRCDGNIDECLCRRCGTVKKFRCNFDEEFK